MDVDKVLIITVSLALSLFVILYIVLVIKFVLKRAREQGSNDDPAPFFLNHFSMWYPKSMAQTKCIPVQPRTYEELQKVTYLSSPVLSPRDISDFKKEGKKVSRRDLIKNHKF